MSLLMIDTFYTYSNRSTSRGKVIEGLIIPVLLDLAGKHSNQHEQDYGLSSGRFGGTPERRSIYTKRE